MIPAAYVMAAMLRVAEPGCSDLSRVPLPFADCNEHCQAAVQEQRGHAPAFAYRGSGFASHVVWPGWTVRETYSEGLTRFATVATAISKVAGNDRQLVHLLVTIARHESAFLRSVHDGTLRGQAGEKGLWQVHPSLPEYDECRPGVDLGATVSCALVAAEQLKRARRYCGTVAGTIALYGSGQSCQPSGAWVEGVVARLATYNRSRDRARLGRLGFGAQLAMLMAR